jgi:subfamily B ATP-binding cassette protein MsbA
VQEFRRLWGYFWRYKLHLFISVLCSLVVALCTMAFTSLFIPLYQDVLSPAPVAAEQAEAAPGMPTDSVPVQPTKEHVLSLLNRYLPLESLKSVSREKAFIEVPLVGIALFLLKGIFAFFSLYLMDYIGLKVILELRLELYRKITHQAAGFFSIHETGELISRLTNDVNRLQQTSSRQFSDLVQFSLNLLGLIVMMLYYDWQLALVCGVLLPLVISPVVRFGKRMKRVSYKSQERMAEVTGRLHETISGARVVTGFNMQDYEISRFSEALQRMFKVDVKGIKVLALTPPVMELLGALGAAVLIFYSGSRIQAGTLAPGVLLTFLTAMAMAYMIIKRISRINNSLQQAMAAAKRVFAMIDMDVSVKDAPDAVPLQRFEREIRFRGVTFAYGDKTVLERIDLTVERGRVVALVGSSGAGKTTLVNLIPRFFDVTGGSIEVDGTDIRRLRVESLRDKIAVVTQEIILFNQTVRDNIAYGRRAAGRGEVEEAARAAFAHDFITALPQGYETVIGERGHFLSVGQRQRIAIARALLAACPILILDEATSALDAESEILVQNALANLMVGRTVIVIAHRLSTIRQADTILVLDGGRIAERGPHEELLAAGGLYHRLHRLQFRDPGAGNGLPGSPEAR